MALGSKALKRNKWVYLFLVLFAIVVFASIIGPSKQRERFETPVIVGGAKTTLRAGETLKQGSFLLNGTNKLIVQNDHNLVLYSADKAIWAANTINQGVGTVYLVMQTDGNLVLYDVNGTPLWASNTYGTGYDVAEVASDTIAPRFMVRNSANPFEKSKIFPEVLMSSLKSITSTAKIKPQPIIVQQPTATATTLTVLDASPVTQTSVIGGYYDTLSGGLSGRPTPTTTTVSSPNVIASGSITEEKFNSLPLCHHIGITDTTKAQTYNYQGTLIPLGKLSDGSICLFELITQPRDGSRFDGPTVDARSYITKKANPPKNVSCGSDTLISQTLRYVDPTGTPLYTSIDTCRRI